MHSVACMYVDNMAFVSKYIYIYIYIYVNMNMYMSRIGYDCCSVERWTDYSCID